MLAGIFSFIGLALPFVLGAHTATLNHGALMLLMAGIIAAYVHGFGFQLSGLAALAISPVLTWPLMMLSFGALVLAH